MTRPTLIVSPEIIATHEGPAPLPLQLTPQAIEDFRTCAYRFAKTYLEHLPIRKPRLNPVVVVDRVVHQTIGAFHRLGGWEKFDEEGIVDLMAAQTGFTSRAHGRTDAAIARTAKSFLLSFHRRPYPINTACELGNEKHLTWRRFRRGILASAVADRICQLDDGTIEVIDYRTEIAMSSHALEADASALFLRSLIADFLSSTEAGAVRVTVVPVNTMRAVSIDFDIKTFMAGWDNICGTAESIRGNIQRVVAGESVASVFVPSSGAHCASCPLRIICQHRHRVKSTAQKV